MTLWKLICRLLEWLGLTKSQTTIDGRALTEYDRLVQKLGPALRNVSLAGLSDNQIVSLAREANLEQQQIEKLRQSARLAGDTRIPAEIFYVFVREDHAFDLPRFLKLERVQIETSITRAVRANIIPPHFKDVMRLIEARLEEIRLEKGLLVRQSAFAKLINETEGKPLPGLTVRVIDVNAQPKPREIDSDFTGEDGSFSFTYNTPPNATGTRNFELNIYDQHNQKLATALLEVEIGREETYPVRVTLAVPEIVSPLISEVTRELGLAVKPDVEEVLNKYKILSFAEVLSKGGLQNLPELEAFRDDEVVKQLDQHATLSLLPTDTKTNAALISKDYGSIHAIAKSNVKDLEKVIKDKLKATQAYYAAKNQARYLDSLITEYRVNRRNGHPIAQTSPLADSILSEKCECENCQTAVSPLAYLADLLDYAVSHIRNNGELISPEFLSQTFHQPFVELPASCAGSEERIRQVRIAVEALRNNINLGPGFSDPKTAHRVQQAFNDYVLEAYKALLIQLGTSYDELRLASVATPEKREELRARLAIQRGNGTAHDELSTLLLPESGLTELNLERLFGLHDTLPEHRFSRGAKLGDTQNQIQQWTITNVAWRRTTDINGRIFLMTSGESPFNVNVDIKLYADDTLIASGRLAGARGSVVLAEENMSGVSGELLVNYVANPSNFLVIAALPEFLSWRLNHLRSQWLKEDWPADSYFAAALPFIDPDVIGPDDLRKPEEANDAFKLWLKRRAWVDDRLRGLRSKTKIVRDATVLDLQVISDAMVTPLAYENTNEVPWSSNPTLKHLHELQEKLVSGQELEQVTREIENDFHLTLDSFGRLMAIKARADAWENAGGSQAVTADEWEEVVSILAQALKRTFFDKWSEEEAAIADLFSPEFFWISIGEPVEGTWPAERPTNQPWIDPDLLNEQDVPQSTVGDTARQLLNDRRSELKQVEEEIKQTREASGFEPMLILAFGNPPNVGDPPAPTTWLDEIARIKNELTSSDQTTAATARTHVEDDLHLAETDFDFLSMIAEKDLEGQTEPAARPTVDEWNKLYSLLTRARKARELFPKWITDEDDLSLTYWNSRKARLPQWRASAEGRVGWQQALRARNRVPIIDPDLVQLQNLITPRPGDRAYDLWQSRSAQLRNKLNGYRLQFLPFGLPPVLRILLLLRGTLGVSNLGELKSALDTGELSSARLDQLNTTKAELTEAFKIHVLAQTRTLSEEEWNTFYDILLQIYKRRSLYAKWLQEEQTAGVADGLMLGPESFQLPEPVFAAIPQPATAPAHPWRTNPAFRREWGATLQSRIDQEKSLIAAHWAAVSAVEGATLPNLRDDLLKVVAGSSDLAVAAKQQSDRLLIDMSVGGCQVTTRVAQAIETLQILIWSLRTGQLKDTYPNLDLDAENFDEEWKWLGSYATWRAAIMVFLYPENILLPSLRRQQTPAFRQLVERLRGTPRLTAPGALEAADEYASYFRDVCNLVIEATCEASTWAPGPGDRESGQANSQLGYRNLFYMFAHSSVSRKYYWSTYDLDEQGEYGQTFWEPVRGLEKFNGVRIIGAVPQKVQDGSRYVYLFIEGREPGTDRRTIGYLRYNLEQGTQRWSEELRELPLSLDLVDIGIDFQQWIANYGSPIVLRQTANEEAPPRLAIQIMNTSLCFGNELNATGDDWAYGQWREWGRLRFHKLSNSRYGLGGFHGNLRFLVQSPSGGDVFFFQDPLFIRTFLDGGPLVEYTPAEELSAKLEEETLVFTGRFYDLGSGSLNGAIAQRDGAPIQAIARLSENPSFAVSLSYDSAIRWDGMFAISYPFDWGFAEPSIPTHSGQLRKGHINLAHDRFALPRPLRDPFITRLTWNEQDDTLRKESSVRVAPRLPEAIVEGSRVSLEDATRLGPLGSNEALFIRKAYTEIAFNHSYGIDPWPSRSRSVLAPIEEAYYFLPVLIALSLCKSGEYLAALDWFRNIYNYSAPREQRKVYYGLTREQELPDDLVRLQDWVRDPLNPHKIAGTRANTYTRFTLLSLIRCLLDYADAEFTQDTVESNAQARQLYLTALELLGEPELKQGLDECELIIGELVISIEAQTRDYSPRLAPPLRRLDRRTLIRTVERLKKVWATEEPVEERLREMRRVVAEAARSGAGSATLGDMTRRTPEVAAQFVGILLKQLSFVTTARQLGASADDTATLPYVYQPSDNPAIRDGSYSLPPTQAKPNGSQTAPSLGVPSYHFCVPPNPLVDALRLRAELNLYKLRTCRNIAGLERQLEPYAASTDVPSGLPLIGADGQLVLPGAVRIQPTQYRYKTLIERGKQLAGIAQQMEATFLSLLERLEAENLNLFKARQDARTARAGVRLQDLRVREADDGVELARLQKQLSVIQDEHYTELLSEGLLDEEEWAVGLLWAAMGFQFLAAAAQTGGAIVGGFAVAQEKGATGAAIASTVLDRSGSALSSIAAGLSSWSSVLSLIASQKRREEDWRFQQKLARQNVQIGDQQITVAQSRVRVVGQERAIALMQADHADEVVEFLNTKFTSRDLYDWMSGILEGVYRYFLQQTTAIAKLAENQLAFERQQVPPAIIQGDYWTTRTDGVANADPNSADPDRRGLTGSARLLQDIYRLDQYAFETDRRKLQLSKTVSLARVNPVAFQRFRQTGVMLFATPMEIFDRDFPGHYLRLIKRVHTSVIALIPPTEGVKATLSTLGISRVVIGGDLFQTTVVNRGPESVALTSPINATGLFELEAQNAGEMLLPFEGLGVDSSWEFRMPKAANNFDFSTIADVLLTIEYTALDSFIYREQMIQQLNRSISADRPFSFRHQFADQWYDFHNADLVAPPQQPMVVRFTTRREDFPPNVDELTIQHVTLYFAFKAGADKEIETTLSFTEKGPAGRVEGSAKSTDGLFSTRQANAASWTVMFGKSPFGEWELALPDTQEIRDRFKNAEIEDILFVITFGGTTPGWPN